MQRRFMALVIFGNDQFVLAEGHTAIFRWPRAHQPLGKMRLRRGAVVVAHAVELTRLTGLQGKAVQGFGV
ncbi:hypothetical protein D3C80_2066360 [compost metagenome]